jgi:glucosamine-6-phosphate deaminase
MPGPGKAQQPEVRVLRTAEAATEIALAELRRAAAGPARAVVSFATGGTFTSMLQWLHGEVVAGRLSLERIVATHLDEYEGYGPADRGGMVHELCDACPSLGGLLRRGSFLPVPHRAAPDELLQHEARLQQLGGVELQYLGIGRNGHLAFHEPGVPWDRGYHIAELSATTRDDARARFLPAGVPARAITAGVAAILRARRIVLCAFGRSKAAAVRAMLEGEVGPACPASALRTHPNALVLLDRDAAGQLALQVARTG